MYGWVVRVDKNIKVVPFDKFQKKLFDHLAIKQQNLIKIKKFIKKVNFFFSEFYLMTSNNFHFKKRRNKIFFLK